jgi:hypothetical protein
MGIPGDMRKLIQLKTAVRRDSAIPLILSILILAIALIGAVHFHKDEASADHCQLCILYSTLAISINLLVFTLIVTKAYSRLIVKKARLELSAPKYQIHISRAPPFIV